MTPPSKKQLGFLAKLAAERGQTFVQPTTSQEASAEIKRLLGTSSGSTKDGYKTTSRRTSRAGNRRGRARRIG